MFPTCPRSEWQSVNVIRIFHSQLHTILGSQSVAPWLRVLRCVITMRSRNWLTDGTVTTRCLVSRVSGVLYNFQTHSNMQNITPHGNGILSKKIHFNEYVRTESCNLTFNMIVFLNSVLSFEKYLAGPDSFYPWDKQQQGSNSPPVSQFNV